MPPQAVVNRKEWIKARKALLDREKSFMRERDALSTARRQLPWVKVDSEYLFEDENGKHTLTDLFKDNSQLIVNHFMFGEGWDEGCPSCSMWADSFNGAVEHLQARDAGFIAVSSAPYTSIAAYKKRMGWNFPWLSCNVHDQRNSSENNPGNSQGHNFNHDYHVSFTQEEVDAGKIYYNYRDSAYAARELPGVSVFIKDETGQIFHTYSTYSRGLDNLNTTYQLLDLLPKGRDEDELDFTMAWVRRHDQYDK